MFIHIQNLIDIDRSRKEYEIHMLMRGLASLFACGNIFEKHREWFFQHASFILRIHKHIRLGVTNNINIESGFFFAFSFCRFFGKFIRFHVSAGRHPSL
ncbi:hypothetical protein A3D11_02285 [Candidatus Peribacteria bacterium RIFCSPHIGHO2_02_FULL_49_16]|nr:MAG: hypothetical protein A2880_03745 [Candidatus Peribacteria bacterium RIFCSPHIGHO2_01_FULL_49_38]OGJ59954.1 MAG: hypothetical protein A3D11_02285 [Candidatus Peribacteria bacterium RIFCSPHIGHO2_02_FULL_49_16]